jgi:hypothetical protein
VASKTRAVIQELHEKLAEVRAIDESSPLEIPFAFGNLSQKAHGKPPRLVWQHQGGITLTSDPGPDVTDGTPAAGYRSARYTVRIWMPNGEDARDESLCEVVLEQLVQASRLLDKSERVSLDGQPYSVPTQTEGSWVELGQVIDALVVIRVPVPAEAVGTREEVTIADTEMRTGIESPSGEAEADTSYEVNQWVDPDKYSEP